MKLIFLIAIVFNFQFSKAQNITGETWISPVGLLSANHGATLAELPGKMLMACWYAGSREGGSDVQIFCSQKSLLEVQWSKPEVVVKDHERAEGSLLKNKTVGNPSLFLDPNGILWLFYTSVQIGGWAGGKVDYKTSLDFGKTWSNSKRLIDSFGNLTRTRPILISQNPVKFMLPLYHEFINKNGYTCIIEPDKSDIKSCDCQEIPGVDHLQPAIVKVKEKIYAYLRDTNKNAVLQSEFNLNNLSWSDVKATNLPNPNSSVEVVNYRDKVILVYNHSQTDRSPLSLAESTDGINFTKLIDFEPFGENREFSYPALIQTSDDHFQLAYTYERRLGIKHIYFKLP